jgi:hypothetical protein
MKSLPLVSPFIDGVLASMQGAEASIYSPAIREQYVKFAATFLMVTVNSYFLLSATFVSVIPVTCVVLLGPFLGPLVFLILGYFGCLVGFILWYVDKFPSWIFTGSYGVLRPFVSVPQLAFLIMNFVFSVKTDLFLMEGTKALANHYLSSGSPKIQQKGKTLLKSYDNMQESYKKPSFWNKLKLSLFNMVLSTTLKSIVFFGLLGQSPKLYVVDPTLDAFTTGIQLVAVYTIRIKSMSYLSHSKWCIHNGARIIGFMFPAMLLENYVGWTATFLSLGLGYATTAGLVEDLLLLDELEEEEDEDEKKKK